MGEDGKFLDEPFDDDQFEELDRELHSTFEARDEELLRQLEAGEAEPVGGG